MWGDRGSGGWPRRLFSCFDSYSSNYRKLLAPRCHGRCGVGSWGVQGQSWRRGQARDLGWGVASTGFSVPERGEGPGSPEGSECRCWRLRPRLPLGPSRAQQPGMAENGEGEVGAPGRGGETGKEALNAGLFCIPFAGFYSTDTPSSCLWPHLYTQQCGGRFLLWPSRESKGSSSPETPGRLFLVLCGLNEPVCVSREIAMC